MRSLSLDMGFGKRCTLYTWMDYRSVRNASASPDEQRQQLEADKQDFLRSFNPWWTSSGSLCHDEFDRKQALRFIEDHRLESGVFSHERDNPATVLKESVRRGAVIVVIERRSYGGGGPSSPPPRPSGRTISATQYAQRAVQMFTSIPQSTAAMDSPLASPMSLGLVQDAATPLGDAQPFELGDEFEAATGEVEELAAKTSNEDYAAKMLGYDRDTFGDMIHAMKSSNGLRGDDNVIWHDNGDVYFRGKYIDNMHSY